MKLDSLPSHLEECEHNPKRPVPCEQGCGLVIPKDELKDHNCVRELRALIHSQQQKMADFKQEMEEQRFQISEQKRELQLLKVFGDVLHCLDLFVGDTAEILMPVNKSSNSLC
jgi:E3 ubiquitin-protein ligase NRDP1